MAIEVTSVPDRSRVPSLRGGLRDLNRFLSSFTPTVSIASQRLLFRSICGLLAIALVLGADSLLRSYKYYSRIVDARLANGYLTSRPGLYAAPRVIQTGQRMAPAELIKALRRAGYVELEGSDVWSGSFRESESAIEIRPSRKNQTKPPVIRVSFEDNKITQLTSDRLPLDSFRLEPEVLANDLFYKTGKRETVRYADIPPVLVHAILAIEDHRYFQHSGLDAFGIARALLHNLNDNGEDPSRQGGSTITQQLVKNTYLSSERTLQRKYAEAMLAFALERRLSKEDILALYCNEVYLGQRGAVAARGVREAARIYFGKELKDITPAEAATIAGMIQSPARYSPVHHAEAARTRRNVVLEAMARSGWLDAGQAATIAEEPVAISQPSNSENSLAPYFVDFVNRTSDSALATSAANERIYTTIDLDLQQLAEQALARQIARLDASYQDRTARPQVALVALDPKTGNVLAMVGGRDYAESQLNRATDARRQPGSTFKPFVYAAAIEDGMSPVQVFRDAPRDFVYDRNKIYRPSNFNGGYTMGDVTMRTGLVKSLNVVTVDVALQTGLARIANLAQQFGLPRPERYPSLALGTKEVTPLELAAAYASFVNGGRRVEPKVITSVGEPPATHLGADIQASGTAASQVVSPTTAYMITNMLSAVVDHGTARAARGAVKGTAIAGKTGTSRDGWFVGYSPNLVCAVWIGFDDNQQLGLTGAEAALPAWTEFMNAAVAIRPELGGRNFECPEGIKFVEIDADTGSLSTLSCPRRELVALTDRLAPNVECLLHGNLPDSIGAEKVAEVEAPQESILTQHAKRLRTPVEDDFSPRAPTRVETDGLGRRTLVNAMR